MQPRVNKQIHQQAESQYPPKGRRPDHPFFFSAPPSFHARRTTQNGQFVSLVGSLRLAGTGNLEAVEAARPNGDHKKKRKEHAAKGETPSVKKPKVKSLLQS